MLKRKVFITGVEGMVGSHMVDYFFDDGRWRVLGSYLKQTTNISEIKVKADFCECDVRDFDCLSRIVDDFRPEVIFHLAAQSLPLVSLSRPVETMDINVNGTINLFESIKLVRKKILYNPVVVVACSSAQYGATLTPENVPVSEEVLFKPLHPYGVSKVAQELLAFQYFKNNQIKTVAARIFNTTGPRKINDVCGDFTRRAVLFERKLEKSFRVGNLDTRRAITDVRDLVKALVLLAENGEHGASYNISGERVYGVKDIIKVIEAYLGINLKIEVDRELVRAVDEPIIYGDSTKLKNLTGWKQRYALADTIRDMIDYWRKVL